MGSPQEYELPNPEGAQGYIQFVTPFFWEINEN